MCKEATGEERWQRKVVKWKKDEKREIRRKKKKEVILFCRILI
jgi:hypothetical protein